ncbi:hypothetical protein VNO78_04114 [Psophocarpus tetragonolobus]|uniref:Uncharacterized protein n=1 Tax=Psophocarpus tetragonolobus TaxID=3891 RepID=A0AAN9T3A7_PSOTE
MATEVLRPQHCFAERCRTDPTNTVTRFHRKQRKRLAEKRPSFDDSRTCALLMEKVTILRRGDSLDSKLKTQPFKNDLLLLGTQRLGPHPETVPKQIRIVDFKSGRQIYAGSAFAVSPSPSALPLPSFSRKQQVDDSATRDLRRLLRLE